MIKFYKKLLILLTTIVVVSFLILGFFIHNAAYDSIYNKVKKDLKQETEQINRITDKQISNWRSVLNTFNEDIVILRKDEIIYKSKINKNKSIENEKHKMVKEVKSSNDLKFMNKDKNIVSYARTYKDKTIIIVKSTKEISNLQKEIWFYIFLILLCTLPLIYIIARYINNTYIRPINEVTYATQLLASGKYKVRIPESNVKETKELFINTNNLARTLERLNNEQKLQRSRLETTLENIPSAILMINTDGKVIIANRTYHELFDREGKVEGKNYTEVIPNKDIRYLMNQALLKEKTLFEQVEVNINNIHNKFFEISAVPVISKKRKKILGLVIVMHDITKLKKLENMRKDFVANVSHELRTPITSIKGFAETLTEGAKNDPESLDMFLSIILKESNRIQALIQDLLELSKIEQNTYIPKTNTSLSKLGEEALIYVSKSAEKKRIHLINQIENNVIANVDKDKIMQVLINLLTNAISYTPEEGQVILRIKNEKNSQIIAIKDTGIGIDKKEQKRIFERFYRVDKARSRDSGGTGLGLSITKHIIEAHNGEIKINSKEGEGSTFTVILFN